MNVLTARRSRFALLAAVLAAALGATTASIAADPDFDGVFVARDPLTSETISLERQQSVEQSKAHRLGLAGVSDFDQIQGGASPVRFKAGRHLDFIVRVPSQAVDPATAITFEAASSSKTMRRLSGQKVGLLSGHKTVESSMVDFEASKYLDHFFLVRPYRVLTHGEYCLSMTRTSDLEWSPVEYCFGID